MQYDFDMFLREDERNKGIKLLSKILSNLIKNPTQTQKYGNLNLQKITQKLSKCKPILTLLHLSGFTKSQNNKRLIWSNTDSNIETAKQIQYTLSTIMNNENIIENNDTNSNANPTDSKQSPMTHQIMSAINEQTVNKSNNHQIHIQKQTFNHVTSQQNMMLPPSHVCSNV